MTISQKTADFSKKLFDMLDEHWWKKNSSGENEGMYRPGYTTEETQAMNMMSNIAIDQLKMDVFQDLAGNRYMIWKTNENFKKPVRMAGSHLDAVPNGGRYDGPAGVVAPMAAVYEMQLNGINPHQPVVIPIWRNEESPWYNQFAVGSKLATGALSSEFVRNTKHKEHHHNTLIWSMNNILGIKGTKLCRRLDSDDPMLIDPSKIEGIVETHIEQGSVLEKLDKSLGLVNSIRGNVRFPKSIIFKGNAGHSGTVPQDERADAMRAVGLYIAKVDETFEQVKEDGQDIVWSFPQGGVENGSATTIPDLAILKPEVRSTDSQILKYAKAAFQQAREEILRKTNVDIMLNQINTQEPVEMSRRILDELSGHSLSENIKSHEMPSGAGHDVQVLAEAGVNAGLIFIRHGNNGASHRPDEILGRDNADNPFTTTSDFANAVAMNAKWLEGRRQTSLGNNMKVSFLKDLVQRGAERHYSPN